ncbi:hypothetical protein IJ750_07260 [bacterium]|nr:hypothetical protein [bacterium]
MQVNRNMPNFKAAEIKPRKPEPKPDEGTKPTGRAGNTDATKLPDGKVADMIDNAKNQVGEAKTADSNVKTDNEPLVYHIDWQDNEFYDSPVGSKKYDKQTLENGRTVYIEWTKVEGEPGSQYARWEPHMISEEEYNKNNNNNNNNNNGTP